MSEPKDRKEDARPSAPPSAPPLSAAPGPEADLDFEPDGLLDSLLSDEPPPSLPPPADSPTSTRPSSVPPSAPPADSNASPTRPPGPVLHAPAQRAFPDDEVTLVGQVADIVGLAELTALKEERGARRAPSSAASVPRPAAPPPASQASAEGASRSAPERAGSPPSPRFDEEEVTRVHSMPTLTELERLLLEDPDAVPPSRSGSAATAPEPPPAAASASAPTVRPPSLESSEFFSTSAQELSDFNFDEPGSADLIIDDEDQLVALLPEEEPREELSVPPPPAERRGASQWPDERPAAEHLAIDRDVWRGRAEWLEQEAATATDPQAKARSLLVASELWALVGELERARHAAAEAATLARSLPIAARQLRAVAAAQKDWKAVASALEIETRGAPTPDARVHAAYLSGEVHRLALEDEATHKKKLELAIRASAEDPRAHVSKLLELMNKAKTPPRMRWPESPALAELVTATEEAGRLRGAPLPAEPALSPVLAFEHARRALAAGDRAAASAAVARLAQVDGVGRGALWLAAAIAAPEPKTRGEAIQWLSRLLDGDAADHARRALAHRALEHDDRDALARATARDGQSFDAAERAVLAALTGAGGTELSGLLPGLDGDPALRSLAVALRSAVSMSARADYPLGPETLRCAAALGLGFAQASESGGDPSLSWLKPVVARYNEALPGNELGAALTLELASAGRRAFDVALALQDFFGNDAEASSDVRLAAALGFELSQDLQAAASLYGAVLDQDPKQPLALRALLSSADRAIAAARLAQAAESASEPGQAALYLLEAALRLGSSDVERYDALLTEAAQTLPSLTLTHRLGEQLARERGDRERQLAWLRARRAESDDAVETALDLVREALLVADTDAPAAAALLSEASAARPGDVGLHELHERLAGRDADRASWREAVAEHARAPAQRDLFAQAAVEHQRQGRAEAAARAAERALAHGGGELLSVLAEENAVASGSAAALSEQLLADARASEDPGEVVELYRRLAKIDRARGDDSSALLWQAAILELAPDDVLALRRAEHHYIGENRQEELEPIAVRLASLLDANEAEAHRRLAARIRTRAGAWLSVEELVRSAKTEPKPRLWALRALAAVARAKDDRETSWRVAEKLEERVTRPLDRATLLLRAAENAARLGELEQAQLLLERALRQVPEHPVVLTTLAEVLEARGDYRAAARALEALAEVSAVATHQVSAWHQAAVLWLDKAADTERGRAALERAVALDVSNEDAVVRLQSLYVAASDREKLAELLERRLEQTTDPEERVALEVTRGRALADVGERDQAKAALSAALDANPDHVEALEAFAELCVQEGDWHAAEQAYIRLVRHVPEPARQAQIYRRLAELYDASLPNAERAELAYREVLRRDPDDAQTVSHLLALLGRRGAADAAVQLQTEFLARATTTDAKRERTLGLALVYEQIAGERRKAEALLEKARKEQPLDPLLLRGLAELMLRGSEQRAATLLLDRAANDSRRALSTGRFEPALFEMLGTIAELRGNTDGASLCHATLLSLTGEDSEIAGAGHAAADPHLDDLLAPDLLTPALRSLLRKAGQMLDAAYAVDLRAIKAAPLPAASAPFVTFVQNVAAGFGLHGLEVLGSPSLGPVCLPVSTSPPKLVFGQSLLDHSDDGARYFLMMRCLKVLQARAGALSRTPPIELPIVMSAFLSLFAQNWTPPGVDAKKLADARSKIQSALYTRVDDDVPVLALECIGSLGTRISQLGIAVNQWGNRTGLLAVGAPGTALRGLALNAGQMLGPPPGAERVKWVVRNPEARDLAIFGVSDQYSEARKRLGISG